MNAQQQHGLENHDAYWYRRIRTPNAFILFRRDLGIKHPKWNAAQLSLDAANAWREADLATRAPYVEKAKELKLAEIANAIPIRTIKHGVRQRRD
ncbi:hypothetical protein M422DRAFT_268177 [Sphaerobolus stellatus SS14]|uniref:HMG box domain-containing protein n=1 Tax=Sphaerobolus stellatus (strain SS14) TaxID=990650 RepID=A0A0C9UN75_SPHS4|nr:hypothetical protein M422DRAFT_268177 [Sphaerobolus stellatus SS14]